MLGYDETKTYSSERGIVNTLLQFLRERGTCNLQWPDHVRQSAADSVYPKGDGAEFAFPPAENLHAIPRPFPLERAREGADRECLTL